MKGGQGRTRGVAQLGSALTRRLPTPTHLEERNSYTIEHTMNRNLESLLRWSRCISSSAFLKHRTVERELAQTARNPFWLTLLHRSLPLNFFVRPSRTITVSSVPLDHLATPMGKKTLQRTLRDVTKALRTKHRLLPKEVHRPRLPLRPL